MRIQMMRLDKKQLQNIEPRLQTSMHVCQIYSTTIGLYLLSFVETPRKFIIAELSIRMLGSPSVLIIRLFEFTRPFLWFSHC